ncbi:Bromo adjacent (BAH) domain [Trinorchestia longiramus]|nr:Bromo adjacent (BAH) domain [Trinorchestia longiramus]
MNETLSNYFAEHRFDAESQARLLERSGCANYDQFFNLLVALSGGTHCEELKSYVNGSDLNSNSVPISSVKSSTFYAKSNSNVISPRSSSSISVTAVVQSKPVTKQSICQEASVKAAKAAPKEYLKVKPASLLSSPPKERQKTAVSESQKSSLYHLSQLLPRSAAEESYQQCSSPKAGKVAKQLSLPEASSNNLLRSLSSPVHVASPVYSYAKTKVESSPHVSTASVRDLYSLNHHRDAGDAYTPHQHLERTVQRSFTAETHGFSNSSRTTKDVSSKLTFDQNASFKAQKATKEKEYYQRERKLSLETAKEIRHRTDSASSVGAKPSGVLDFQQQLHALQLQQQFEYLQQLHRRNQSPSKLSTSRCKTETPISTPNIPGSVTTSSMSEHEHRQAFLSWAASQLPAPPLPSSSGLAVSAVSTSVAAASPTSLPLATAKREPFNFVDTKQLKKERHPSGPASSASSVTPGVLSPSASTARNTSTTPFYSTATSTAISSSSCSVTPQSLPSPLSHWPLPPTPCTPTMPIAPTLPPSHTPFWLPHHLPQSLPHHHQQQQHHHQFAATPPQAGLGGVDGAGSGGSGSAGGPGLGYQVVTDPISRHLILVHHAALQDVSNNLMWGYSGMAPLMNPQMLLADPHFPRPLHPALLHASTLHPALHPSTPTLHPPTPTLQPPSSTFPSQVAPSSISLQSSGVKTESPKASPKCLDDNSKGIIHGPASAGASSAYSNTLHSAIPPVMSAGLTTGLPGLPSSMTPGLSSPLSTAMPSVLSSVMPTGLAPGLASSLPPTLPHYLYPPSSLPLFCPKPPMYPLSAFVQTPTSPVISVMTTATTASTNTSPSSIGVHNSGLLGLSSKETDISQSSLRATMSLPTPPTVVLSPQLPKSPTTKRERAASSPRRSHSSTPTLVLQPKSSPSSLLSSSTIRSSVPKIKLDNVQDSPAQLSTSSTNFKNNIVRSSSNNKIAIKKEIKEEYMSPIASTEKEHSCVDLSINGLKGISNNINNRGSIKQESGVPDSTKNSLNQSGVVLSSNVSSVNNDGSVHLPSLNSNPVVPDAPRINTAEVTIPISSVGVTTATTSKTTTSVVFDSLSCGNGVTTTNSSPVPTYRHLSVQTVPQLPFYRHSERSSSVGVLAAAPVVCSAPITPKLVSEVCTANYNVSLPTTDTTALAPVQEQALDLSGLELLSDSVVHHANRLSSEEPADVSQEEFVRDQPTDLRANIPSKLSFEEPDIVMSLAVPTTSSPNIPSYSSVGHDVSQFQPSDAPLNFSMNASSEIQSMRSEDRSDFVSSSPPSTLQPTGSRENFIFLCALAEEELFKGSNNEKDENGHVKTVTTSCTMQPTADSRRVTYSKEILSGRPGSFDATHGTDDDLSQVSVPDTSTVLTYSASSDIPCSTEAGIDESNVPYCADVLPFSHDLSAYSSPLDLSLGVSKKVADNEPANCSSPKVSESELSLILPSVGSNSPSSTRTSDGNHSCDSLITEKLLGTYDSSSSDSQNFEGFEDSSLRRTEENMRRQLVVLAKQYREKVRQVQRQFPKSDVCSSSHKSQRPSKRKRCPSESSRRSESRHAKHHRGKDGRKRLASLQDTVSCRRSSEENTERKSVPALSISKLKSKKLLSPRHDSRMSGHRSSSDEENESSDEDNLPRRKWSLSFLSNDTKPSYTYKSHLLSPIAPHESDDERGAEEDFSDSSETNSKAPNTETSAVESSDHETSFLPRSSSKKRKPGRPKKHSPTKKDATETLVTKKRKNLNLLLRHSSATTSKSKVKPKLKAEVREIPFDAHESSDDHKDTPDENDCEADISFLKKVDISPTTPAAVLDVQTTSSSNTKVLSSLTTSTPIAAVSSTNSCNDLTKRRKPGGSSSLTRRAIMRDKAKRKTDAEHQYQMEALFRSLKKRSTLANAEHDESEEEDLDYDSDQSAATSISAQPPAQKEEEPANKVTSTDVVVKTETNNVEVELTDHVAADLGSVTIKTEATKDTLDTNVSTSMPEVGTPVPLGLGLLSGSTRTPSVCHLAVDELVKGCRVLLLRDDGLLYAGSVNPITPPDLYGLIIDGERGSKGHIYCAEELLTQAWKEVKPGSTRFLKEGTRVCCFWSQQYRALYSGTVGSASTSPAHSDASSLHNFVNVEFDDGDSGRIHVDDIRLLPQDYPVTVPKPNPLLTLCTRKRRAPQRDSTESRPIIPSCSSLASTSSSTSVKLTVTTSASGMCRVTSSTTSTVNASQYGAEFTDESLRSKKSRKTKKKKKTSSKKQQKRLSREWEEESANGTDIERNDIDKPKVKKIKLSESEVVNKEDNVEAVGTNASMAESYAVSHSAVSHSAVSHAANTGTLVEEYTSELGKSSKKKKKKHSKSEESSHKKRKHKHKKNKNRHDDNESLVYKCDTGSSQGTVLTIHSSPVDSSCNQSKVFPHVEQVDGDLRVRIKSPPPNKPTTENIAVLQNQCNDNAVVQGVIETSTSPSLEPALNEHVETKAPVSIALTSCKITARNQRDGTVVASKRIKECREKAKKRIRDSSRPKRSSSRAESVTYDERSDDNPGDDEESSADEELSEEELSDGGKAKVQNEKSKIPGKKSRHHSGRSKIAAFLPEKDLWQWSGRGSKKTTGKGRGRKIFYKEIVRGDETIRVGDCCVFRSSGPPDNPYIGRIEHLCEGWGGSKSVTVHWFYHPNEIQDEPKKLKQPRGALFESNHRDTNDLQTISYKCQVLPLDEYRARHSLLLSKLSGMRENNTSGQSSATSSGDAASADCCTSCNTSSGVLIDALDTNVEMFNSCSNCAGRDNNVTDTSIAQGQADSTIQMEETSFDHFQTPADSTLDEQNNLLCKSALFEVVKNDKHFTEPLSSIGNCTDPISNSKSISRTEDKIPLCPADFDTESSLSTNLETLQTKRPQSPCTQPTEAVITDNSSLTKEGKNTLAVGAPLSNQNDLSNHNSENLFLDEIVSQSNVPNNSSLSNLTITDSVNTEDGNSANHTVSSEMVPNSAERIPEQQEAENGTSSSLAVHSSSSADSSSSSEDSDDENDVLNECYYLAGTYDVIHQVLRMEPGVE